jgi:hypothetical protein
MKKELTEEERHTLLKAKTLLQGKEITEGEIHLIDYLLGFSGGFYTALFEAFKKADHWNQIRLGEGFPEEFQAIKKYQGRENEWFENLMKLIR